MRRLGASFVAAVIGVMVGFPAPSGVAAIGGCGRNPDFDGDGSTDLAVGIPDKEVNGVPDAGAVHVILGGPEGLTASGDRIFDQDVAGIGDAPENFDGFGSALAAGDFDGDGQTDLAIAAQTETVNGDSAAGLVHVLYGTPDGLSAAGSQVFHQDVSGMADDTAASDLFGRALASGDFDNDGRCDLAIGVPGEDGADLETGAVHTLYGSASGLTASGDALIDQDLSGVADSAENNDQFGAAVASGDFDADGRDDLAVGIHLEDIGAIEHAGAAHVFYGSSTGLTTSGDQFLHQNATDIGDMAEEGDNFGVAVAAGDFDGNDRDDLAVGVLLERPTGSLEEGGAMHVIYGSAGGLSGTSDALWHQDSSGMADESEGGAPHPDFNASDSFGRSLATGDFDNDGRDDVAIGVPFEDVDGNEEAGAIHVMYGGGTGLSASGDQFIHQDVSGMADAAEGEAVPCGIGCNTFASGDEFGRTVTSGDFDRDGRDDVTAGVPLEDVTQVSQGAVHVVYGSSTGLTASGDQFIHQDVSGFAGTAALVDRFGSALIGSQHFDIFT